MSIEEKKDKLIEELLPFDDHFERFNYIIDRAKSADPLPFFVGVPTQIKIISEF